MRFSVWNSFHLPRQFFLNSYMPCSVYFVGNRLLTSDILRLAISILFVSCRGRNSIETSLLFRTQNNSRNSTWNCYFLNMILRNPIYTPTISLKPIKDMQQHAVLPSCAKYLYITERECHVCVTQKRKCNALQTGSWLNNLSSRPGQSLKTIPAWNYPVLGRLSFFSLYFSWLDLFSRDPTLTTVRIFVYSFWSLFLKVS